MRKTMALIFLTFSIAMFMAFGTMHIVFRHNEHLRQDPSLEKYLVGPVVVILGITFLAASVICFTFNYEANNTFCCSCNKTRPEQPDSRCPECNSLLINENDRNHFLF